MPAGDIILKTYTTEEKVEENDVEILPEGNGKQYPPRWIPINRRGEQPETPKESPDDITNNNLYFFKKDLILVLINIMLFCSNLDLFRVELTEQNPRIAMIILISISFVIQIILGISAIMNSPFFTGFFKNINNANFLNDLNLCSIFLLLIVNVSMWVCDVLDIPTQNAQ